VPVLEGVYGSAFVGYSQIDFSRDGKFVYRRTNGLGGIKVQWLDSTGGLTPLLSKQGLYAAPRLSPDGTRLALDVDADIWVYELGRETITRITFNGGAGPVWTPNGKYILFRQQGIWWVRADGGGKVEQLLSEGVPTSFTPDGKTLTYSMPGSVWTVPIEEEASRLVAGKPQQIPGIPASPYAMFSPDGKWIAYSTIESGRSEVYVRAWPDNGAKWQISSVGGRQPVWSRNGRELFWKGFDSLVYGASYRVSGGVFQAEKPRTVASRRLADGGPNSWTVDVHPDGKRFVVLAESVDVKPQSTVTLLFNFFDEIKRKLAQGVE
jgi:serine/threonine-protein kinase